ncbi:hypothetical protein SAVIM40S_07758 [Streptomyces avidinii]
MPLPGRWWRAAMRAACRPSVPVDTQSARSSPRSPRARATRLRRRPEVPERPVAVDEAGEYGRVGRRAWSSFAIGPDRGHHLPSRSPLKPSASAAPATRSRDTPEARFTTSARSESASVGSRDGPSAWLSGSGFRAGGARPARARCAAGWKRCTRRTASCRDPCALPRQEAFVRTGPPGLDGTGGLTACSASVAVAAPGQCCRGRPPRPEWATPARPDTVTIGHLRFPGASTCLVPFFEQQPRV